MNHYFIHNKDQVVKYYYIDVVIDRLRFELKTANNVFSYHRLDEGSRILIETIKELNLKETILDLGCGYGVIGIALKLTNKNYNVTCSDINPICCELTSTNIDTLKLNIDVIESDGFINIDKTFDTIVFNPPIAIGKERIYAIYKDALNHLNENGCMYLVIRKNKGALSHMSYLSTISNKVDIIQKKKGYHVLIVYK